MDMPSPLSKFEEACNGLKSQNASGVNKGYLADFIRQSACVSMQDFFQGLREVCDQQPGMEKQLEKCAQALREHDKASQFYLERMEFMTKMVFVSRVFGEDRIMAIRTALERNPALGREHVEKMGAPATLADASAPLSGIGGNA